MVLLENITSRSSVCFLIFNPFVPNALFIYPQDLTVFWCFQGLEKGCIGNEWVKINQFKSSHQRCSVKKGVKACNFIKERLQHKCFPVKFGKFLRTIILKKICERLLPLIITFVINFEQAGVWFYIKFIYKVIINNISSEAVKKETFVSSS